MDTFPTSYLIAGLAALALVVVAVLYLRWRRSPEGRLRRTFNAISEDALTDVVIPDGMGGEIELDRVLLNSKGLLVVDLKEVHGAVFGSEKMQRWTVIDGNHRNTFDNPLPALRDRVAAVRRIASDVPVSGWVVFGDEGEFPKGQPDGVIRLSELQERYPHDQASRALDAFRAQWDRLRESTRPI